MAVAKGLADNSTLITTASQVAIQLNNTNDTYDGAGGAHAFVFQEGQTGDDTLENFGSDDSIINYKMIYDGNKDGYISFGPNAQLDIDRTSSKNAGEDQITVTGNGNARVTEIRYLGGKDGGFAYADASTRDSLFGHFTKGFDNSAGTTTAADSSVSGQKIFVDNDVSNNTWDFSKGAVALLTDNATGLNFGGDTLTGLGRDDLLIFTSKLYDSDGSGKVTFGSNYVLDLSGAGGPSSSDPNNGNNAGGQFDTGTTSSKYGVYYLGEKTVDGHTYYYYGTDANAHPDGVGIPL